MSILQALQEFLEGYEGMELRPLGEVLTDLTRAAPPAYSLAPAGGGTAAQDVVGNRYYTSRYHFFALECAGDEADRAENYDFLESLASWLEDQGGTPWPASRCSMPRSTTAPRMGRGCMKYKSN